jgi:hexosaminidase
MKRVLRLGIAGVWLLAVIGVAAAPRPVHRSPAGLVPKPARLQPRPGHFALNPRTAIVVPENAGEVTDIGRYLSAALAGPAGAPLEVISRDTAAPTTRAIRLELTDALDLPGQEAYALSISPASVVIKARTAAGIFWGVQTLTQLIAPGSTKPFALPCAEISDTPRFGWRGLMLDCSRTFLPKEFLKRYIDLLAYHKLNRLHLHLTDDQGWRIEIRKYPNLTLAGSWYDEDGKRIGGYYTQADIRELLAYAKSRYVMLVPEIELPGHALGALAAYPELGCARGPYSVHRFSGIEKDVLCAGRENTYRFAEDVLSEVMDLFPSPYIHVGGDEVPKDRWKQCPDCQARIRTEGLKDEAALQNYFVSRIAKFIASKGRRMLGWDEILEGGDLPPGTGVQQWHSRGRSGYPGDPATIAAKGLYVVASPTSHCYFDYTYKTTSVEKTYSFDPLPPDSDAVEGRERVLGGEGAMWTHLPEQKVDTQVFPRLSALAEALWSPRSARNWVDFSRRLKTHERRLAAWGVDYYRGE